MPSNLADGTRPPLTLSSEEADTPEVWGAEEKGGRVQASKIDHLGTLGETMGGRFQYSHRGLELRRNTFQLEPV